MGHLLVLYTQVDQFIMETCAARIASAPTEKAKLGLAKQVGDECRHVTIQKEWIGQFGVDPGPVIGDQALQQLQAHFADLDWVDFLTDLYLVIEALGSQAVEEVVPLADPGTRESLRIPLHDELDHVAFGLSELREALAAMDAEERETRLQAVPQRVQHLVDRLAELGLPVFDWFEDVGSNRRELLAVLDQRKGELLDTLAA
jgi:hypothetical protein